MANILPFEKQVLAVHALTEGSSIRSIERMTGMHRDTIMRLGVRVGNTCAKLMDESMRNLDCVQIQIDEVWGFIGKKQRNTTAEEETVLGLGDVWTYVALDPESKLVPTYVCGKRDYLHTQDFTNDLASRLKNRVQISTDGMNQYLATIEDAFGADVDHGQIIKVYGSEAEDVETYRRYSPPHVTAVRRKAITGDPDPTMICTSHVERHNLTTRMHVRRLTRLTNAFSKKFENFQAAMGLWFAYYNMVKIHKTLRCTPAMAAGVTNRIWKVDDLVARA